MLTFLDFFDIIRTQALAALQLCLKNFSKILSDGGMIFHVKNKAYGVLKWDGVREGGSFME